MDLCSGLALFSIFQLLFVENPTIEFSNVVVLCYEGISF